MRTSFLTKEKSSILLIYTGGTIGMKEDPTVQALVPFNFSQILEEVPELNKFAYKIDTFTFDPLIDSSDVEPSLWISLAGLIEEKYDDYDGFVILHGTDTMAYSASALSFMIEGLTKPVIFTGSQLPIGMPRTDGKENLISSVEIAAAKDENGHAIVPEVCICFDNILMRGNRTTKINSDNFRAFRSENCPPLAEAGINIRYNRSEIIYPQDWEKSPVFHKDLDTRVSILKLHPGITPQVVRSILCSNGPRAVIIETYGAGNAPSKEWFLNLVREATDER
jgi:L-asparaginase